MEKGYILDSELENILKCISKNKNNPEEIYKILGIFHDPTNQDNQIDGVLDSISLSGKCKKILEACLKTNKIDELIIAIKKDIKLIMLNQITDELTSIHDYNSNKMESIDKDLIDDIAVKTNFESASVFAQYFEKFINEIDGTPRGNKVDILGKDYILTNFKKNCAKFINIIPKTKFPLYFYSIIDLLAENCTDETFESLKLDPSKTFRKTVINSRKLHQNETEEILALEYEVNGLFSFLKYLYNLKISNGVYVNKSLCLYSYNSYNRLLDALSLARAFKEVDSKLLNTYKTRKYYTKKVIFKLSQYYYTRNTLLYFNSKDFLDLSNLVHITELINNYIIPNMLSYLYKIYYLRLYGESKTPAYSDLIDLYLHLFIYLEDEEPYLDYLDNMYKFISSLKTPNETFYLRYFNSRKYTQA